MRIDSRYMKSLILGSALMTALVTMARGQGDRPCVTVARASMSPIIDGCMEDMEWQDAAAVSGFVKVGGATLAEPNSIAYLLFDKRALYVAVKCVETEPGRPRGFRRAHDDRAFEDDSVQVYIAPEDLRQAKTAQIAFGGYAGAYDNWYADIKAYYEFTVNCRGSRTEARNDVRDWDAPWEAKVGRNRDGWVAEFAIPFTSVGVDTAPENSLWGFNVFRIRQPELSGWVCPAFGGYTPTPLGAMLLVSNHPVARQLSTPTPQLGANEFRLNLRNPTAEATESEVAVTPSGGSPISRAIHLSAGSSQEVVVPYNLSDAGDGGTTYHVKVGREELPLISGLVPLRLPEKMSLSLRYYSLPGEVEGAVHLASGSRATKAVLSLQPEGGPETKAQQELRPPVRGSIVKLPVKGKVGDRYHALLEVFAADGKTLAQRTYEFAIPPKPSWIGTKSGLPLHVLSPWTPMKTKGKTVEMLGKRFTYQDLALPATITSAGAEMLAAPIRVVVSAGGKEMLWQSRGCKVVERSADHVKVESVWRSPGMDLRVTSNIEYDGFCWNELTLTPHGKVTVGKVALDIPLRKEVCRYAYEARAQAAHALSPFGLRRPLGSDLWIGDESRGLAWLAESLEWVQAKDRGRQVEIVPGATACVWRSTFIDSPTQISTPYRAKFALHVTPTKPVSLHKSRIFHGAYYGLAEDRISGSLQMPAKGNIDLERGTLEFWVKPTFDPNETYDPKVDRSVYNRMFLSLTSSSGEAFILYYNADERSFRFITAKPGAGYPVILCGPVRLTSGEWNYVGLSWGDSIRLGVNGKVAEFKVAGSIGGSVDQTALYFNLGSFQLDEMRFSKKQRPVDTVPTAPFSREEDTLFLHHFEDLREAARSSGSMTSDSSAALQGKFGNGIGSSPGTRLDQLAAEGKRIVIFHESWSRFQGYPDLEQVAKLKKIADGCHERGMLFLVYFCQMMSDAAPEWKGMENDFMALPERMWYHRDDVKQDCYVSCVNGPFGDLLLEGIAKLADEAGIDGVYMDGTTVHWDCANPTHPGCGENQGDGTYLSHEPIRATRKFMKRLRNLFAQRRKEFFLDAHTGGAIQIATQSFCDGYWDGEHLARYKPGFRLSPDTFLTGYMGKQFGFRGEFLANRHTMDEALAISLIHDTAVRGQPAAVDKAWADYEDTRTKYIPYWEKSPLYTVTPKQVLGSLYLKRDRALLVLGSQTERTVECKVDISRLLKRLPVGSQARDAITQEELSMSGGKVHYSLPGREWRMIELKVAREK